MINTKHPNCLHDHQPLNHVVVSWCILSWESSLSINHNKNYRQQQTTIFKFDNWGSTTHQHHLPTVIYSNCVSLLRLCNLLVIVNTGTDEKALSLAMIMAVKEDCGKIGGPQECAGCGKKIHDKYLLKVTFCI